MCLGGCWKEPVLCLPQHIEGFERSKLNLDRLNLTQTHATAHALTAPVIRLSTNIIWVEWWVFSEMHLFPSHYWRQEGGGGGTGGGLVKGGKGGCYWYAPCGVNTWLISCRHSNDCLLWLICTSCRLPTEHTHREQVNANELQTFKGTFGSKSSAFRGCPIYSHVLLNSTYWKLQ